MRLLVLPPKDLAGLHHERDPSVGCIACHGGHGTRMRMAVRTVAALDTLKFLAGAYREPTHMKLPLRDAECRPCHTPIVGRPGTAGGEAPTLATEAETEGRSGTSYHAIREHDTVRVACVRCHGAHTTDSDAASRFISKTVVVPVCQECHKDM